jgi:hypothetical protein
MGAGHAAPEVPWFWSDQFGLNLKVAGCCACGASKHGLSLDSGLFAVFKIGPL